MRRNTRYAKSVVASSDILPQKWMDILAADHETIHVQETETDGIDDDSRQHWYEGCAAHTSLVAPKLDFDMGKGNHVPDS